MPGSFARDDERALERQVSRVIGDMPFLWMPIQDEPGPQNRRGYIEQHAIGLLSNYNKPPLDLPSRKWLGRYSKSDRVIKSGLWNSDYVDAPYDPRFLDELSALVSAVGSAS